MGSCNIYLEKAYDERIPMPLVSRLFVAGILVVERRQWRCFASPLVNAAFGVSELRQSAQLGST
ncbi:hypothetical protein PanWU01x14_021250, partial [Parasponia andersonii]